MGQISYTTAELDDAIRETVTPSILAIAHIDETPLELNLTSGVWQKIAISGTIDYKGLTDFGFGDLGGGDIRFQYQGTAVRNFITLFASNVSIADAGGVLIEMYMSRGQIGGTPDAEESGSYIKKTQKLANEWSTFNALFYFTAQPNDVLAVWIKADTTCTAHLYKTSIVLLELA